MRACIYMLFERGFTVATFVQEGTMPVASDCFTMTVSRTVSSEHSNSKDVGIWCKHTSEETLTS